ncbi:MAG: hypothetical protein EWM72_02784 [Nitrospira sp.]|nr:MAG: hypothetical protein EWM72_02784 [Nitrospira sp.]
MKPRILQLLVFVLLVGTWGSDKWFGSQFEFPFRYGNASLEVVRRIIQDPQGRHLRILNRSFGQTTSTDGTSSDFFRLGFARSDTITAIRTRVQVQNFESTGCPDSLNLSPSRAAAQIVGFFFNTDPTGPRDGSNDVIAAVQVERLSNSTLPPDVLEITYFVIHCLDFDCVNGRFLGGGVLGTVTKGQWVRLLLQWDKDNDLFIFRRDTEPPATFNYRGIVTNTGAPGIQVKTLGLGNFVANCNFSPRPGAMVDALFDNVFVNESALP